MSEGTNYLDAVGVAFIILGGTGFFGGAYLFWAGHIRDGLRGSQTLAARLLIAVGAVLVVAGIVVLAIL